jgi:hypothetical protein
MSDGKQTDQPTASAPSVHPAIPTLTAGTQGQSPGSEATTRPGLTPLQEVRFNALRSAYGHEDRESHYSFWHRVVMFFVTLAGTAAFASLVGEIPSLNPKYIVLAVTVLGLIDLVLDLTGKAREHDRHRYRFLDLYADAQVASEKDASKLNLELHKIYAGEPILPQSVNVVADNRAMRSLGRDPDLMIHVPVLHGPLRHFCSRTSFDYKTVKEYKESDGR